MNNSRIVKLRPHLWPLLFLLAVTFAVYGRVLGHDFLTVWDDNSYITDNADAWGLSWEHLRSAFSRYYLGNYAPVQILSYMLDYEFWGLNPGGFLFSNIVIHTLNGLLVYRLFFRWYGDRLFCLFASALFLLHPVQVESVAWISQRKNLLSMLFFLLAWEGYCRYREAGQGKGRLAYVASVAAFVLSLLAKSMTVVFPVVLVMYDLCFPGGGRRFWLRDKIPYVLASGIVAAIAVYSEKPEIGGGGRTGYHGGSPWATFLTMLPVFCRYLGMLFWPAGLSAEYAPIIHRSPDLAVVAAASLLAAVSLAGVLLFRIDRRLGFWVAFFWVGLLPLSQIVPMLSMINDRYLYLPMMGVAALAGWGVILQREWLGEGRSGIVYALLALLLLVLSVASFNRAAVWSDSVTLLTDTVAKAPASDRAWWLLADAYRVAGDDDAERRTLERALAFNPNNTFALNGLGSIYSRMGELDKGLAYLKKLLELNPRHATGWVNLGNNYRLRKNYAEAEKSYRQALLLQPGALLVDKLLVTLAIDQGHLDEARNRLGKIEGREGKDPEIAYLLTCVESLSGRRDQALSWLETALQRGYRNYDSIASNEQLSALWGEARFRYLLLQYFPEEENQ